MRQPSEMPDILRDAPDAQAGSSGRDIAVPPRPRRLWGRLPWFLFALLLTAALALWLARRPIPLLTAEALAGARARWHQAGPPSYEFTLEIRATGLAPATVHAVVHGRKLAQMTVDGEPASSAEPATYTVEGLLDVLGQELSLEARSPANGGPPGRPVVRAQFDPATGIPLRFLRMVPGTNRSTSWRVIHWRPLPDDAVTTRASMPG